MNTPPKSEIEIAVLTEAARKAMKPALEAVRALRGAFDSEALRGSCAIMSEVSYNVLSNPHECWQSMESVPKDEGGIEILMQDGVPFAWREKEGRGAL